MVGVFMFPFKFEKCYGIFQVCLVIKILIIELEHMLNGDGLTTDHVTSVLACYKFLISWPLSL